MMIEKRLEELKLILPDAPTPVAAYVPAKLIGDLVYISGQGPIFNGKMMYNGKLGDTISIEEGQDAARYCALNALAQTKKLIGDLDLVEEIVSVHGFIASSDDFFNQHLVLNGASQLLINVFGERGRHTRCALGTNTLPTNIPVEVEMILKVRKK